MKGFITIGLAIGLFAGTAAAEMPTYREIVDVCYPWRYSYQARQEVHAWIAPQVENGHVLDQTIWNSFFVAGTDRLTAGGMEHLTYLARRRPCPDPVVYVQTAQDTPGAFDPEHASRFVDARNRLDGGRIEAVRKFLMAYTAGRGELFTVVLHDPPEVGMGAVPMNVAVQKMSLSPDGVLILYGGVHTAGGR